MDSRVVTRVIRQVVWPSLKECGFSAFTGRTAWRYWDDGIDVINIQAYSPARHPDLFVNPTSFSFAVNLGVSLAYVPVLAPIDERDGVPRPAEYQYQIRRRLQHDHDRPAFPATDIWFVEQDGSNARKQVENAGNVIRRDGLPWFERFHDSDEVFRALMTDDVSDTFHGCGALPSPMRSYVTAYAAHRIGNTELAAAQFQHVLDSGVMRHVEEQVINDLRTLTAR